MSRTSKDNPKERTPRARRTVSVRVVRREPIDTRKFGRALLQVALAQAAAEAEAEKSQPKSTPADSQERSA